MARVEALQADLKSTFKHEYINTSVGWGTEQVNNNVIVTFYKFNVDNIPYPELRKMASRIGVHICQREVDLKDTDHIKVNFTKEEDPETASGMVTFILQKPCK